MAASRRSAVCIVMSDHRPAVLSELVFESQSSATKRRLLSAAAQMPQSLQAVINAADGAPGGRVGPSQHRVELHGMSAQERRLKQVHFGRLPEGNTTRSKAQRMQNGLRSAQGNIPVQDQVAPERERLTLAQYPQLAFELNRRYACRHGYDMLYLRMRNQTCMHGAALCQALLSMALSIASCKLALDVPS
eukprot:928233-Pleurochrysis_carterae.AAC.1